MKNLFGQTFICLLIFFLTAGQAAAFDLHIGPLNFNPPAADTVGHYHIDDNGVGAIISIPLGFSNSDKPTTSTLNGQDLSRFTQQDAKDSLIVIMLFGVAIAAGALTVSAASN